MMIDSIFGSKKRVLIVEDEESLSLALAANFEAEGYTVDVAYNGEEAIGHLRKIKPDLILLDLMMPKKDGFLYWKRGTEARSGKQFQ
jgi:DNA-binding response OmpR family regulator